MTKFALRFHQLPRLRTQATHRRDIQVRGLVAVLEPYAVPAQRRRSSRWP